LNLARVLELRGTQTVKVPAWLTRDGNEPLYMMENAPHYLFSTKADCCKERYSWNIASAWDPWQEAVEASTTRLAGRQYGQWRICTQLHGEQLLRQELRPETHPVQERRHRAVELTWIWAVLPRLGRRQRRVPQQQHRTRIHGQQSHPMDVQYSWCLLQQALRVQFGRLYWSVRI
jgi:hypothetical protein